MPANVIGELAPPVDVDQDSTLATPKDTDVVISGISCRLPESDNMAEFQDNLMNGVDMVTDDNRRWEPGYLGLPRRNGKLKDITHFDAALFGVSPKQANCMEPQLRLLLEVSYEAILDAGVNPQNIRGTRTGVFVGFSGNDSFDAWSADAENVQGYMMTGCQRGMFANRLSYYFDFNGPSFVLDTACSSSLLAMDHALEAINSGQCDAALVGGTSLSLKPAVAAMFMKLGMLSPEGSCKSFDVTGNGYCRSEGIVAVYLQKAAASKRIYTTLVHSRSNCDGNKEQGITFPSGRVQKQLLQQVYSEAGVNPADIAYVEAHGTGTKAGDPQEVNSITDVFCKGRQGPLKIGSVKSNMGHPEPVSGLAAVAKIIIAMETGTIPANLHYNKPNPDIPGLADGRLAVIDKNTRWQGGLVGVNSFGFGGTNVHAILKSNTKKATSQHPAAKVPRLCIYSGRTEACVNAVLTNMQEKSTNVELQSLLTDSANVSETIHRFRGFTVLNSENKVQEVKKCQGGERRPVWYVFSGMGTQWHGMGRDMMQLDVFRRSIERSTEALLPCGLNLYEFLMHGTEEDCANTVNAFVGIAAIQVALIDLLREFGIHPDGIVGHSVGELGCGYADGVLTAEQTVLAAYWRGKCVYDAQLPLGAMAAVGLSWEEAKRRCPENVVPACHNTKDTVTVSGPKEAVSQFVASLKAEGVFAKEVDSAGNAFHSYYMSAIAPSLKEALDKVIPNKRPRTDRWISSSIPQEKWHTDLARYSSADYYVNNLVSPVLFQEALQYVPDNAITVEIAPHALLQAVLKRSLSSDCDFVGLMKRGQADNVSVFLSGIGKCFAAGLYIDPLKLYPSVEYPVPRGTPMISPWIQLDHRQTWNIPTCKDFEAGRSGGNVYEIDVAEEEYLLGHKIDGRVLFPATGYLCLAWQTLAKQKGVAKYEEMAVRFENVEIHRATVLQSKGTVSFEVSVMPGGGDFEIRESDAVVVSGRVTAVGPEGISTKYPNMLETNTYELTAEDVYKEIRLRGYEYGKSFQGIWKATMDGTHGYLMWNDNWVTFTDTMLQMSIVAEPCQSLRLPTRIKSLTIDPELHKRSIVHTDKGKAIPVCVNRKTDRCYAGGVEVVGLHTTVAPRRHIAQAPTLEQYTFIPYEEHNLFKHQQTLTTYAQQCLSLIYSSLKTVLDTTNGITNRNLLDAAYRSIVVDELIPQWKGMDTEDKGLLKLLMKIFETAFDDNYLASVRNVIASFPPEELESDPLLNCLSLKPALKTCLDLVLENCLTNDVNVLEIAGPVAMFSHAAQLLSSQPQVNLNYRLASEKTINLNRDKMAESGIEEEKWKFSADEPPKSLTGKMNLVVMSGSLHQQPNFDESLRRVTSVLKPGGFLLVQEITRNIVIKSCLNGFQNIGGVDRDSSCYLTHEKWQAVIKGNGFEIVAIKSDGVLSTLYLCRLKETNVEEEPTTVRINSFEYEWVEQVKTSLASSAVTRLWLVADSNPCSGIMGMVNCLVREPGGQKIRCVFNVEPKVKQLEIDWQLLRERDLLMNIFKNGEWGSYRHLPLAAVSNTVMADYAYVNVLSRGDLSSLHWIESPLKFHQAKPNYDLCHVHYAALNFRDIMLATGKLPPDAIPGHLTSQDCLLGLEVSGRCADGHRVMGLLAAKGLATVVDVHEDFLWPIPDHWSLEEAASVPVVYATAYYALVVRGNIQKGMRVLIHSGSGGVGQAAIAIALHYGCEVFTTVGSAEKRKYLTTRFPQLNECNFGNSRDTSFELEFLEATNGEGMDVVLNSLAGDKLEASVRLLAKHGRFLEIGKYDLSKNTQLGMSIFLKNISFHGILLDALFNEGSRDWKVVRQLMNKGLESGVIQPLQTTCFDRSEVEQAFRFMAQGKHIGKVVLRIRKDKESLKIKAIAQTLCDPRRSYVITGGLGGFGVELAQWLIDRGARKILLTSRTGIRTGFQARRIKSWQVQGVNVAVSTCDTKTEEGAEKLMADAQFLGKVGGIFHLAMVLKDGLMENQTQENYAAVGVTKVSGTVNLDAVTRRLCPTTLEWFVVFSSVSCGRGNAGQSNYGFANSVMERVCEARRRDGLPALAIQWGAIGDVGVVINNMGDNETVVGGTIPQRLSSCLQTLDKFLHQKQPVVSSFVLAEKAMGGKAKEGEKQCIGASIARILGVSDPSIINPDSTLADLGLDSLMGVEVKQVLERDLDSNLNMQDIRQLTLKKILEMQSAVSSKAASSIQQLTVAAGTPRDTSNASAVGIIGGPSRYNLEELVPLETLVVLNEGNVGQTPLYIIHPIEGSIKSLRTVGCQLACRVYGVQCTAETPMDTVEIMAKYYIEKINETQQGRPFRLGGYSFGCTVAIEMCLQLQSSLTSIDGPLILLDGSHTFVSYFTKEFCKVLKFESGDPQAETEVLVTFVRQFTTVEKEFTEKLVAATDLETKMTITTDALAKVGLVNAGNIREAVVAFMKKITSGHQYQPFGCYHGNIALMRVRDSAIGASDYDLKEVCDGDIAIHYLDGNHKTFVQDPLAPSVVKLINNLVQPTVGKKE